MKIPNPSAFKLPSIPMARRFPVGCEFHAGSPPDASRSTSAASSARWPRGGATTPASFAFSSPVISQLSTQRGFWLLLTRMLSGTSSLLSLVLARPASRRVIRIPVVARRASRGVNRTLAQRLRRTGAKPNLAQQRTATGCHGSCFPRSGVCPSSRISTSSGALSAVHPRSYRASPPRSLSLGSLGVARIICNQQDGK